MTKNGKAAKPAQKHDVKEVTHYVPQVHIAGRDGMVHFRSAEGPQSNDVQPNVLMVFSRSEAVDIINKMVVALRDACEQEG